MKVLHLIPYLAPVYGGTAHVVPELASALGRRGLQVDVVTTNANGDDVLPGSVGQWHDRDSYRVQYFPTWHRYDLVLSRSLLTWLWQHLSDYDLLHSHTLFAPMLAIAHWMARRRGVPYVMTPHGMLDPWAIAHKAWKKDVYFRWIERPTLTHAAAIHALNQREKAVITDLNVPTRIHIIPNGVALPPDVQGEVDDPIPENAVTVVYLGRINPKKGLDRLIHAVKTARSQHPNLHLVLAGPDALGYRATLQRQIQSLNLENAVTFTGLLTGDRKWSLLKSADVFVYPSLSEGFSIAILEAMAMACPCIITTGCNFPEATDVAYIVEPEPEAIAAALHQVLVDLPTAKILGDRAQHFVQQRYTWAATAATLQQVYTSLISNN
jgi:glycosyltransferase involved in cell wall biosynthesis